MKPEDLESGVVERPIEPIKQTRFEILRLLHPEPVAAVEWSAPLIKPAHQWRIEVLEMLTSEALGPNPHSQARVSFVEFK